MVDTKNDHSAGSYLVIVAVFSCTLFLSNELKQCYYRVSMCDIGRCISFNSSINGIFYSVVPRSTLRPWTEFCKLVEFSESVQYLLVSLQWPQLAQWC